MLLFLIMMVLFVPYVVKYFSKENSIEYNLVELSHKDSDRKVSSFSALNDLSEPIKFKTDKAITYFNFDPNTIDEVSWSKLGFSEKQIRVIMNYRAKGGKFYRKEDLSKIYSISTADFARIAPYIRIAVPSKEGGTSLTTTRTTNTTDVKKAVIDINLSDTSAWQKLYGIGPVLSKRIVKYRDALGGFHSVEQLKEVYGLPVETFENIKSNLRLEPSFRITKININHCTEEELNKHPYINKKQAKTILNYRNQHGKYDNLESLYKIKSLDSVFLRKIGNYLDY